MTRYRLRFLLQEIDLPPGETVLGRSASCHVTIEDPLVSRQHARIVVSGDRATIEDMGSRNGLLINARAAGGQAVLQDGDRIRIGTQELVFCAVRGHGGAHAGPGSRPTGFMCHCAHCGLPYPAELILCPSCGSRDRMDEDTISGIVGENDKNWTLELLVDVLDKAVSLERWEDVERMLRRSQGNVDERVNSGQVIAREHLDRLAAAAAALAAARSEAEWGCWVLEVYATLGLVPREEVIGRLSTLPPAERASLAPMADRMVRSVEARGAVADDERACMAKVASLSIPPHEAGG